MTTPRRLAVLAAVALVACSACTADEPAPTPTMTPLATPTETADAGPDPAVVADVLAAHTAYWDAVIASENGPDTDPARFAGVAAEPVTTAQIGRVAGYQEIGMRRAGEPVFGEPEVVVEDDTATVEVCVDQGPWVAVGPDGSETAPEAGFDPIGVRMELTDDRWIVVEQYGEQGTTLTC